MFKKVLVAEDMDSINLAVAAVLQNLDIDQVEHAQYCDKAWLLAKKAIQDKEPFQLLICDLSFKHDHHTENIGSGKELINLLKQEDPNIKVLVNTIEDHPHTVRSLWDSGHIDAYVCKDRNGMRDLQEAILALNDGQQYNSESIEAVLKKDNLLFLGNWEIEMLKAVATGLTQEEIQEDFKNRNISPSSKSSIEKRLKELREEFGANTTPHLIGILKDLKII
ncbi:helix-turn-helix domain-containing protein [Salinimicrobium xinjiangense]|uniref:response regulator transcription factor n=1 Tax=Salinimicrobium xinjiangense TaxID=438596 RepID=UPI0003F79535|nr:response regulator transcription factor [Salinimicrobium xinjiangense]